MRRESFDRAGAELAEEIVADIPATSAEIAAKLPEDVDTLAEGVPELADDGEAFTDDLPDELLNRVDDDTADFLSVLLPDDLLEELD